MRGKRAALLIFALLAVAALPGCRNTAASYGESRQQVAGLTERVAALEAENSALTGQVSLLNDTLAGQQRVLAAQQRALEEEIHARTMAFEAMEQQYRLQLNEMQVSMDEIRAVAMGAEMRLGALVGVDCGEVRTFTFDPVIPCDDEENPLLCYADDPGRENETLTGSKSAYCYGYREDDCSLLGPMNDSELQKKVAYSLFAYYVLDGEVVLMVEVYVS